MVLRKAASSRQQSIRGDTPIEVHCSESIPVPIAVVEGVGAQDLVVWQSLAANLPLVTHFPVPADVVVAVAMAVA